MATNYDINYNDQRFQEVEADKKAALNEVDVTYGNMINNSDKYYQEQIDASKDWADKQTQLQNEKTDFAIEQIEQQKDQAHKDYLKEQSGAYVDWRKESNEYGANAEEMAASGLSNTGFSESSQVSMYNTYQNRVATAREAYGRAVLNYDNAIKDAQLQNNSVLAEIAYEALQQQLELSLQGFQYKNTLLIEKANKKTELDQMYHNRYQDVLKQINTENALAEEVRQYNESLAMEQKKLEEEIRQYNASLAFDKEQFAWQKAQAAAKSSGGSGGGGGSRSSGGSGGKSSSWVDNINNDLAKLKGDGNTGNGNTKIDTKSVMNLGYGPISGTKLAQLEKEGKVKKIQKGNTLVFEKADDKDKKFTSGGLFSKYPSKKSNSPW